MEIIWKLEGRENRLTIVLIGTGAWYMSELIVLNKNTRLLITVITLLPSFSKRLKSKVRRKMSGPCHN